MTSRSARLATSIAAHRHTYRSSICSHNNILLRNEASSTSATWHPPRRRNQSSWAAAVNVAQNIMSTPPPDAPIKLDPFQTVAREMKFLTGNIRQLLGSGHPTLDTVAKYYTQSEGKYVRPMLVLLMSRATALTPRGPASRRDSGLGGAFSRGGVDTPITDSRVLVDENPDTPISSRSFDTAYAAGDSDILPSQRRLAEITELIHTASLLHDDVIDHSTSRRSAPSANIEFGNKMAVLAGDFLLGRASVALARLRDPEVTELLATVIANLVEGEFMQLKNTASTTSGVLPPSMAAARHDFEIRLADFRYVFWR